MGYLRLYVEKDNFIQNRDRNIAGGGDAIFAFIGTNGTTPTTFLAGIQNRTGYFGNLAEVRQTYDALYMKLGQVAEAQIMFVIIIIFCSIYLFAVQLINAGCLNLFSLILMSSMTDILLTTLILRKPPK